MSRKSNFAITGFIKGLDFFIWLPEVWRHQSLLQPVIPSFNKGCTLQSE
jgi:hypothetical protein